MISGFDPNYAIFMMTQLAAHFIRHSDSEASKEAYAMRQKLEVQGSDTW